MTPGEIIALISAVASVLVGGLGAIGYNNLRSKQDETKYQITNDHAQPLREDLDDKHHELVSLMKSFDKRIDSIRNDITQLRRDLSTTDHRVDDIYDTWRGRFNRPE